MSSGCVSDIINSGQLTSGVKFITVSVSKLLLEKFMYILYIDLPWHFLSLSLSLSFSLLGHSIFLE